VSEPVAVLSIGGILLVTAPADLNGESMVRLQEDLCAKIVDTFGDLDDIRKARDLNAGLTALHDH
jgi:hypothetical protein